MPFYTREVKPDRSRPRGRNRVGRERGRDGQPDEVVVVTGPGRAVGSLKQCAALEKRVSNWSTRVNIYRDRSPRKRGGDGEERKEAGGGEGSREGRREGGA